MATQAERTGATRERLLDAAVAALIERGHAGASLPEICRRAGVSRGAQLHHFPTRADVLAAAVEHLFKVRHRALREHLAAAPAGVDGTLAALWELYTSGPLYAWLEASWPAPVNPELRDALARVDRRFDDEAAETLAAVRPAPRGPGAGRGRLVTSLLDGLATNRILRDDDAVAREVLDLAGQSSGRCWSMDDPRSRGAGRPRLRRDRGGGRPGRRRHQGRPGRRRSRPRCRCRRRAEVVDAAGLLGDPGFIDLHTHYDAEVELDAGAGRVGAPRRDHRRPRQLQPVAGGRRPRGAGRHVLPGRGASRGPRGAAAVPAASKTWDSLRGLPRAPRAPCRSAPTSRASLGHSTIRAAAMGLGPLPRDGPARPSDEQARMERWLDEALDAGYLGLSIMHAALGQDGRRASSAAGRCRRCSRTGPSTGGCAAHPARARPVFQAVPNVSTKVNVLLFLSSWGSWRKPLQAPRSSR